MSSPQPQTWLVGRNRLAARLREARAKGGRSVRTFSELTGMASSKVSRIENGHQMPTGEELDTWAKHAGLPDDERAALHRLRDEALTERSLNRRRLKGGQAAIQAEYNQLSAEAALIRTFQTSLVPSLLQTPDYARAIITATRKFFGAGGVDENDIDAAVRTRMERGELLKDRNRRFDFIVWEAALHRRYGNPAVMRGQMFHLGAAIGLTNVRLGIIPLTTWATVPTLTGFILYDDFAVVEGFTDDPRYGGSDAKTLHDYMDALWAEAVEGDEARRLILTVSECLPDE